MPATYDRDDDAHVIELSGSIVTDDHLKTLDRVMNRIESEEGKLVLIDQVDPNFNVISNTSRQIIDLLGSLAKKGYVLKYVGLTGKFKKRFEIDGTLGKLDTYDSRQSAIASYSPES